MPDQTNEPLDSIESALEAIAAGELIVVVDDECRENEGDLIMAADKATPETINMMIREGRGLICVPMNGFPVGATGDSSDGPGKPGIASH